MDAITIPLLTLNMFHMTGKVAINDFPGSPYVHSNILCLHICFDILENNRDEKER
jgi:hypothetical protein